MLKRLMAVVLLAALAAPVQAQNSVIAYRAYNSTRTVNAGDSTNSALRVNIVAGGVAATVESVATANNDGASLGLTTTSATILASYATRKFAAICSVAANTQLVYIKLGTTATSSDFVMSPGTCLNLGTIAVYSGRVDGIAASGTQTVTFLEW